MDDVILGFVHALRRAGLRVSSSEAIDAITAAEQVGLRNREVFKAALRASLVKRERDIPTFDELFDLYFNPEARPPEGLGAAAGQDDVPWQTLPPNQQFLQRLREAMERLGMEPLDRLTEALLAGNVTVITAEMLKHLTPEQLQQLENWLQQAQVVRYVLDQMGWQRIVERLMELARALQQAGEWELAQQVRERLWELEELFPRWVADQVREAYRRTHPEQRRAPRAKTLYQKEFAQYSPEEIQAMQDIVEQLARRLRDDISRRMRRGGIRRLDVRRTLRASYRTMGVPMELVFREHRRNRLRLAVLCDVSSSVRTFSRFMLHLVYTLQQQHGHVRSFVFISDIDEVTDFFQRHSLEAAVEMATSEANIRYWAHSNFGEAFRQFLERYSDVLNRRTTVIILGDGRNNFYEPGLEYLAEIRARSRQVIWLNPENQWAWGTGDSIIHLYARECDLLAECRNLQQLMTVMDYLTKRLV